MKTKLLILVCMLGLFAGCKRESVNDSGELTPTGTNDATRSTTQQGSGNGDTTTGTATPSEQPQSNTNTNQISEPDPGVQSPQPQSSPDSQPQ